MSSPASPPPQQLENGHHITTTTNRDGSTFFLFMIPLALISWFICLVSQSVVTARIGNAFVGPLWFAIILQLLLLLVLFHSLRTFTIPQHASFLTTVSSIVVVFSVLGVDKNLFHPLIPAQRALSAGYLLTAIIDSLLIGFLTLTSAGLPLVGVGETYDLGFMGNGGRKSEAKEEPRRSIARVPTPSDAFAVHPNNPNTNTGGGPGPNANGAVPGTGTGASPHHSGPPPGSPSASAFPSGSPPTISDRSTNNNPNNSNSGGGARLRLFGGGGSAAGSRPHTQTHSASSGGGPGSRAVSGANTQTDTQTQIASEHSLSGGGAGAGAGANQSTSTGAYPSDIRPPARPEGPATTGDSATTPGSRMDNSQKIFPFRAEALYGYIAGTDDPTEISFKKGDILEISDRSGKWWEGRGADGRIGIVPSNYLRIIE